LSFGWSTQCTCHAPCGNRIVWKAVKCCILHATTQEAVIISIISVRNSRNLKTNSLVCSIINNIEKQMYWAEIIMKTEFPVFFRSFCSFPNCMESAYCDKFFQSKLFEIAPKTQENKLFELKKKFKSSPDRGLFIFLKGHIIRIPIFTLKYMCAGKYHQK